MPKNSMKQASTEWKPQDSQENPSSSERDSSPAQTDWNSWADQIVAPLQDFKKRSLKEMISNGLKTNEQGGLEDEITMLRTSICRLFEMTESQEIDIQALTRALGCIATASARLAALLKAQKELKGARQGSFEDLLTQAIREVNVEMGINHER